MQIKVYSKIRVINMEREYDEIIPKKEEFDLLAEEYEYSEVSPAHFEIRGSTKILKYLERGDDGQPQERILMYNPETKELTIRKGITEIKVIVGILKRNQYRVPEVGVMPIETYGNEITWNSGILKIVLDYYSNIGGVWSHLYIVIENTREFQA